MVSPTPRMRRAVAARLWLALLVLLLVLAPLPVQAQDGLVPTAPVATSADGFVVERVATVGQNGFTAVSRPDGVSFRSVFSGTRNGEDNIWRLENGAFTPIIPINRVLPNDLGSVTSFGGHRVTATGDVVFFACVDGGSLPAGCYVLRWRNGVITAAPSAAGFTPVIDNPNFASPVSDGRWLVRQEPTGIFPRQTRNFFLTDGDTLTPVATLVDTAVDGLGSGGVVTWCTRVTRELYAVNAKGVYAYSEMSFIADACAGTISPTRPSTWTIKLGGAVEATLDTGNFTNPVGVGITGVQPRSQGAILSDANELVFTRLTIEGSSTVSLAEVVAVAPGGAERVLFTSPTAPGGIFGGASYLDAQGRIAGIGQLNVTGNPRFILKGNDPASDILLKEGDPLFGSTLLVLQPTISVHQRPGAGGENRVFLFQYELANGEKGIGRIARPSPRWSNPFGGTWATAGNWTPNSVPLPNELVTFGPATTYDVVVGDRTIGGILVEQGEVRLIDATLEISTTGTLAVSAANSGADPFLAVGTGRALAGASQYNSAVQANVFVGPGELSVTNAVLLAPHSEALAGYAELGGLGPAIATVTGGAEWRVQSMLVGTAAPAQLRVEDGAFVRPVEGEALIDELIVGGSGTDTGVDNQVATVRIDNATNNAGINGLGAFVGPVERLVVGSRLVGRLEVVNGGVVAAVTTNVGTRDHGALIDGELTVEGVNATGRSLLTAGRDVLNDGGLFVATGAGTRGEVNVLAGGLVTATQLTLAGGVNSSALMSVDGLESTDQGTRRSVFVAPFLAPTGLPQTPNPDAGKCIVGLRGQATLNVSNGAQVRCGTLAVGSLPGSRGELNIGGTFRGVLPVVVVVGTSLKDALDTGRGFVCIGRVARCGGASGTVRGDVNLSSDGLLDAVVVAVGPGGRLRGNGTVGASGDFSVFGGGLVAPGVSVIAPKTQAAGGADASSVAEVEQAPSAGTLTVQGNLTLSNTAVISMQVLGPNVAQQDRIVVSGQATLAGTLLVEFAGGYVPQQGDTILLIQAGSTTGAFATVTLSGLPAGFQVSATPGPGGLTLTVTDAPPQSRLFLPLVRGK